MASANEIGVIPNERSLNRSRHFSGEIDQVEGTSSACNDAVMLVGSLSEAAMQNGRMPLRKVSLRSSAYEGDGSFLERQIKSTAILFYIGHALLLPGGRFWRPRTNHDLHPECPHSGRARALYTGNGLVPDLASAWPRPRSLQSLGQSATTASELVHPCPRPGNVQRHGTSPHSPQSRTLRGQSAYILRAFPVREPTSAAACPRPRRGIVISMSSPRSCHHIHQTESPYVPI